MSKNGNILKNIKNKTIYPPKGTTFNIGSCDEKIKINVNSLIVRKKIIKNITISFATLNGNNFDQFTIIPSTESIIASPIHWTQVDALNYQQEKPACVHIGIRPVHVEYLSSYNTSVSFYR